jgi:hypothetical protein
VKLSAECRHVDLAALSLAAEPFSLLFLAADVAQALLQGSNLAEPLHLTGLAEPLMGVALDLQQARDLGEGNPEHGTSDTRVLMLARGSVWPVAAAQSDLAEAEMIAELCPFGVGGFTVFLAGPVSAALVDELPVVADYLGRVDGDISLSCVQVEMAE